MSASSILLKARQVLEPTYQLSGQSKSHGDVPVTIDVAKFDAAWRKDKDNYVGPAGKGGIGNRYEAFGKWVQQGHPISMSEVNFNHWGEPQFGNGRHRYAWLRDHGERKIQIAVPPGQRDKFVSLFT